METTKPVDDVVTEEVVVEEAPKLSEDEQRAVNLGWKPKEQWTGPEDGWVPAKWWLKYGDVEQKAITLEMQDKQKDKVIKVMKDHYVRVKDDAVKEVIETIKRQKRVAVQNEDFQRVAELDVQAEMLENNLKNRFTHTDHNFNQDLPVEGPPPEFYAWNRENSWYRYGDTVDELTNEADTLAVGYKQRHPNSGYKEVLSYVEGKIKKMFPEKFQTSSSARAEPISAVDDGGPASSSSNSVHTSKTYKLNAEEKAAAAAFGIPEAEYAKDLQKFDQRKGR